MVGGVGVVTAWRCSVLSGMGAGVKVDRGKRRRQEEGERRQNEGRERDQFAQCEAM